MKRLLFAAFFLPVFMTLVMAQTPADDQQQLLALIKEVQAQQAQMADNQAKIEQKLSGIAENLRVSRIYSGREQ